MFVNQGTGPWNLEVQVVGPRSSENIEIQGIDTPQKTLEIPVPKSVDTNGGTFEINIGQCRSCLYYRNLLKQMTSECRRRLQMQTAYISPRHLRQCKKDKGSHVFFSLLQRIDPIPFF